MLNLQKPFGLLCEIIHTTSLVTTLSQRIVPVQDFSLIFSLVSNDELLDEIIDEVLGELKNNRKNKLNKTYEKSEETITRKIINALYQSYFSIPKSWVSLSLRAKHYSGTGLSYRALRRVFNILVQKKLIIYKIGNEYSSKVTRIYPAKRLIILFKKIGHVWRKYEIDNNEVIIVREKDKNKNKKLIKTPNNKTARTLRKNLNLINEELSKHCLALDIDDDAYLLLEKELKKHIRKGKSEYNWTEKTPFSINYSRFKLVRIFSNKKLNLHGRFYGGWWQSLPERYRQHITIDGRQTLEVDYSTLALRMIYSLKNKPLDDSKDPFDLGLKPTKEQRKIIKKFAYALINDTKGTFRLSNEQYKILGVKHNQLLELIKKHHPPLIEFLKSEIGLKLMYLDSVIAEDIILSLLKKKILVLPIHDSFIVGRKYVGELTKQMNKSFKKILKQNPKFDISEPKWRLDFYNSLTNTNDKIDRFNKRNYEIDIGRKSSLYLKYYFSWKEKFNN